MQRIPLFFLLALVVPALLALGACGDDDDGGGGDAVTDEVYFTEMDAIDDDLDTRFDAVFSGDATTAKEIATGFLEIVTYAAGQYDAVTPSADTKDAHETLTGAIEDFETELTKVNDDLDEAAPAEEFESLVFGNEESDIGKKNAAIDESFCAIQKIADDKNIEADVGCEAGDSVDPSTLEAEKTTEVLIEDFTFQPAHIEVKVGDTVTWTLGADGPPHTATADDGSFDSDLLEDEGATFEFTFEEAGDFSYICTVHPEMLGLVTVVE